MTLSFRKNNFSHINRSERFTLSHDVSYLITLHFTYAFFWRILKIYSLGQTISWSNKVQAN